MKKSEEIKSAKRLKKEAEERERETARAEKYMRLALKQARAALREGEVPIGAVVVRGEEVIARAHNAKERKMLATAHAEILATERASKKKGDWRLNDCDIFVTLEPCTMCAGAIASARYRKVYFGAFDQKGGACGSLHDVLKKNGLNANVACEGGVLGKECEQLLSDFFGKRRTGEILRSAEENVDLPLK